MTLHLFSVGLVSTCTDVGTNGGTQYYNVEGKRGMESRGARQGERRAPGRGEGEVELPRTLQSVAVQVADDGTAARGTAHGASHDAATVNCRHYRH